MAALVRVLTFTKSVSKLFQLSSKKCSELTAISVTGERVTKYGVICERLANKIYLNEIPIFRQIHIPPYVCSSQNQTETGPLNAVKFEKVCDETLESLSEYFEEIIEACGHLVSTDVTYGDGVLTVKFGEPHGTYVINRQSPNQQIWLSSPTSGPKRYDFQNGQWIYRHDGIVLHDLLTKEISIIVKKPVDFSHCLYS